MLRGTRLLRVILEITRKILHYAHQLWNLIINQMIGHSFIFPMRYCIAFCVYRLSSYCVLWNMVLPQCLNAILVPSPVKWSWFLGPLDYLLRLKAVLGVPRSDLDWVPRSADSPHPTQFWPWTADFRPKIQDTNSWKKCAFSCFSS
jgi:hypothetical protein